MARQNALTVTTTAVLALTATLVPAQDRNAELMKKIYAKLVGTFALSGNEPTPGKGFLVLANPGIILDPTLKTSVAADRESMASLLNRVPLPRGAWHFDTSTKNISDIYSAVLEYKQVPIVTLTTTQEKELAKASQVLFSADEKQPSQKRIDYDKYWQAYIAAQAMLQNEKNKHFLDPNYSVSPVVSQAAQKAKTDWDTLGHKAEVETALGKYKMYKQMDPAHWWSQLDARFQASKESSPSGGPDFETTTTIPAYDKVTSLGGWTDFGFSQGDLEKWTEDTHTSYGGSIGGGWGLWRFNAGASHSETDSKKSSKISSIDIKMKATRVLIDRRWMEGLVFTSRYWKWGAGAPDGPDVKGNISNGQEASLAGWAPLIPTSLLVVRDVSISGLEKEEFESYFNSVTSGGGSIGWGPFSLGGHYHREVTRTYAKAKVTGNTITISEPQIIGWYCEVLPIAPNQLDGLNWGMAPR